MANAINDTQPLSVQEFLRYADQQIPGIASHPGLTEYLPYLRAALAEVDPVRVRAKARMRGWAPALTRQGHIDILKSAIKQTRTAAAKSADARTNPRAVVRYLRGFRRNGQGRILQYGADVSRLWELFTTSTYQSADLPLLAVREALQNSADAIRKAVELKQIQKGEGQFEVDTSRSDMSLTFTDNGTGMDENILASFLSIGDSPKFKEAKARGEVGGEINLSVKRYKRGPQDGDGSYYIRLNGLLQFTKDRLNNEAVLPYDYVLDYTTTGVTGGFGVAKAVILGCSPMRKWEIWTQDLYLSSDRVEAGQPVLTNQPYLKGTRLTVYGVPHFDRVEKVLSWGGTSVEDSRAIEERIQDLLASNHLPGIRLLLNGREIQPYFDGRRGLTVPPETNGLTALRGSSAIPGTSGYPFNTGRDKFNSRTEEEAFNSFRRSVEKEPKMRVAPEDELYDPRDSSVIPQEQKAIQEDIAGALNSEELKKILQAGSQVAQDFQRAYDKELRQKEVGQEKQKARLDAQEPVSDYSPKEQEKPVVFSPAEQVLNQVVMEEAREEQREGRPSSPQANPLREQTDALIALLQAYNQTARQKGYKSDSLVSDLFFTTLRGWGDGYTQWAVSATDILALYRELDEVQSNATRPGGGGLSLVLAVENTFAEILRLLDVPTPTIDDAKRRRMYGNPFGAFAGLYISRAGLLTKAGKYDSARALAFKSNYTKYLPVLVLWDRMLRMVATTYGKVEDQFFPGFVLDDRVIAVYVPRIATLAINPFFFKTAKRGYNNSRDLASFLHGIICHEMAHLVRGSSHGGDGGWDSHDTRFSVIREDIAARTYPLIPVFSRLLSVVLGLPEPVGERGRKVEDQVRGTQGCPQCYAQLIAVLEADGRLDTVEWLKRA